MKTKELRCAYVYSGEEGLTSCPRGYVCRGLEYEHSNDCMSHRFLSPAPVAAELKPCPFCGSSAMRWPQGIVGCGNEECFVFNAHCLNAEGWNRRADDESEMIGGFRVCDACEKTYTVAPFSPHDPANDMGSAGTSLASPVEPTAEECDWVGCPGCKDFVEPSPVEDLSAVRCKLGATGVYAHAFGEFVRYEDYSGLAAALSQSTADAETRGYATAMLAVEAGTAVPEIVKELKNANDVAESRSTKWFTEVVRYRKLAGEAEAEIESLKAEAASTLTQLAAADSELETAQEEITSLRSQLAEAFNMAKYNDTRADKAENDLAFADFRLKSRMSVINSLAQKNTELASHLAASQAAEMEAIKSIQAHRDQLEVLQREKAIVDSYMQSREEHGVLTSIRKFAERLAEAEKARDFHLASLERHVNKAREALSTIEADTLRRAAEIANKASKCATSGTGCANEKCQAARKVARDIRDLILASLTPTTEGT